jgi:F0F1-type ATP synthase assembly protein I
VSSGDDRGQVVFGLALASAVSQVGCATVAVVLVALVVGLGLDRFFDTRPLFTLLFLLGSIPVSLYVLVRIAFSAAAQLNPPPPKATQNQRSEEGPVEADSEDVRLREE